MTPEQKARASSLNQLAVVCTKGWRDHEACVGGRDASDRVQILHVVTRRLIDSTESLYKVCRGVFVTRDDQQIVPGLSVSTTGQATVDRSIADVLFDLAIKLGETTAFPADVQHVVAALVLSARNGKLDSRTPLSSDDSVLVEMLAAQVKTVFAAYADKVGIDD